MGAVALAGVSQGDAAEGAAADLSDGGGAATTLGQHCIDLIGLNHQPLPFAAGADTQPLQQTDATGTGDRQVGIAATGVAAARQAIA